MNKYSISDKNKYNALVQFTTAEERCQMMKESMLESAKEHIPVKERQMMKESMLKSEKEHIPVIERKEGNIIDGPRNFRPYGREKESQGKRTEIQRTR